MNFDVWPKMVLILQYIKRALSGTLCYRQNRDQPQLSSVSGNNLYITGSLFGSGTLTLQKWIIDRSQIRRGQNPKIG